MDAVSDLPDPEDTSRQPSPQERTGVPPGGIVTSDDESLAVLGTVGLQLASPPPDGAQYEVNLTRSGSEWSSSGTKCTIE